VIFNANTPDNPGTFYQSYAGISTVMGALDSQITSGCNNNLLNPNASARIEAFLLFGLPIVGGGLADNTPHDAIVPLSSAMYGTFQGCIPVDHLEFTGRKNGNSPQVGVDPVTGWDPVRFYRNLAFALADMGY
jgi:hypothetical protein